MKSYIVHYRNKFPGGRVDAREDSVDAYDKGGNHVVALRKDGGGGWRCCSDELDCAQVHDLSPLPKNARFLKLYSDGSIGQSEEHDSRRPVAEKLAAKFGGFVPSIEALKIAGEEIDRDGNWVEKHS